MDYRTSKFNSNKNPEKWWLEDDPFPKQLNFWRGYRPEDFFQNKYSLGIWYSIRTQDLYICSNPDMKEKHNY